MHPESEVIRQVPGVTIVRLRRWISRGWVSPAQSESGVLFTELDIARCRLIRELRDDLEIDNESLPVVLKLLDQVYDLRRELRTLTRAVDQQGAEVRRKILEAVRQAHEGEL